MARITLDGIAHSYDQDRSSYALKPIDHEWTQGRSRYGGNRGGARRGRVVLVQRC